MVLPSAASYLGEKGCASVTFDHLSLRIVTSEYVIALLTPADEEGVAIAHFTRIHYQRYPPNYHINRWPLPCTALLTHLNFRTAVPFWAQTTRILSGLPPKRDCGSKRVSRVIKQRRQWWFCYTRRLDADTRYRLSYTWHACMRMALLIILQLWAHWKFCVFSKTPTMKLSFK